MKITFLGAGSTIFAKNVLGDCILTKELGAFEIALLDIDMVRLKESETVVKAVVKKYNPSVRVKAYTDAEEALRGASYVINAIQVGGYEPCTVIDFEIPKKYGLLQTIGDTLGVGGVFRALRTIPIMEEYARIMERVCPNALFLNYTNPMSMLTGYIQKYTSIQTVGLCHSVQQCVPALIEWYNLPELDGSRYKIAGINHMAWLLEIADKEGNDLYPLIKKALKERPYAGDLVRAEIVDRFGFYNTESSEHTAEYHAWFIKNKHPELIERFNIPLDEYPRRCIKQIADWKGLSQSLMSKTELEHIKSHEYGAYIIKAAETGEPTVIHGNVLNNGIISNLPNAACVEVPIMVDKNGFNPCVVGELPLQLAALNMSAINVQLQTIQAARSKRKDDVYMSLYLDPHCSAELTMDEIKAMCDDLFEAHKDWLPKYK